MCKVSMYVQTLGSVILTRILKFVCGQGYAHYFDNADSNGGKNFGIKTLLRVANHRRNFTQNLGNSISFQEHSIHG